MTEERIRPVVVGVDGSAAAAAAVDVAAAEALARGAPLRIVHAYVWPLFYASLANVAYRPDDWEPAEETQTTVRAARRRLAAKHSQLVVDTAVLAGGGGQVLVDESTQAELVVIGARGVGGLAGRLGGSVAPHLAAHAHCPVLIVPAPAPGASACAGPWADACVGVDGTASSLDALAFACDWAARHGASVDAVHVVARAGTATLLDSWLDGTRTAFPTVEVRGTVLVAADVAGALLRMGRSAGLVVVGSRHRGPLRSAVLGSVGHELVRRSRCPVAVVPGWPHRDHGPAVAAAATARG